MPAQIIEDFRKHLCKSVPLRESEWELIKPYFKVHHYLKKESLIASGDKWNNYAFVMKGCFRHCFLNRNGQESVISFFLEYNWIGDSGSLTSDRPSRFNIEAVENSCVIMIDKSEFALLSYKVPVLGEVLRNWHYNNFISCQYQIHVAHTLTALEKYLYFLKNQPELLLRIPQRMIASYLGVNPETLSRARKKTCRI